jgi:hypothetical protein
MAKWLWIERKFSFDFPVEKWPEVLERWRGTPPRLAAMLADVPRPLLSASDGRGWTILQNVGHLVDLAYLPRERVGQILAGEDQLVAADMANLATKAANHNERYAGELIAELRTDREELATRLERLGDEDWARSGIHPRLKQRMRLVDLICFDCEHDDYHLARVRELLRTLS